MAEVIFVPAGCPYFKDVEYITSAEHRIKMLELALKGKPISEFSLWRLTVPVLPFAVDTLALLKKQLDSGDECIL